jgi:hypothetical protein
MPKVLTAEEIAEVMARFLETTHMHPPDALELDEHGLPVVPESSEEEDE